MQSLKTWSHNEDMSKELEPQVTRWSQEEINKVFQDGYDLSKVNRVSTDELTIIKCIMQR